MARCDRCQAPQCMFYFGPCDNCGLPSYLLNNESNNNSYPDIRPPEKIEQDRRDREWELGKSLGFSE